jgi:F0F1-type ATP synthase assembly protein I
MTNKETGKKGLKKSLKSYLHVTSSVFQMGAWIAIGAYGGKYLDQQYSFEKAWFTMLGTLLGLSAGLYTVLKSINPKP